MAKQLYRHPVEAKGTFVYQPWSGDLQIIFLADLDGFSYYLIDDGIALPVSESASFQLLTMSKSLADALRPLVLEGFRDLVVSDADKKQHQIDAINTQRDIDINAGVTFEGVKYHSSNEFLLELLGILFAYQLGLKTGLQRIRTLNNQILELEQEKLVLLAKAIGDYREDIYETSWATKDAL